jgi:hypothetical protein
MQAILRSILAVIVGLVLGSSVNMGVILLGPHVVSPPAGVNVSDIDSMRASIHLFEARHFLFPFLAHVLGTLAGATVAFLVAAPRLRSQAAFAVGGLFLAGGIVAASVIPAPTWFVVLDLTMAYLPAAWMGILIGRRLAT